MRSKLLREGAIVALATLVACGGSAPPPSAPSPLVAKPMPEFRKRALAGEEVDTQAMRGHAIVVKFFADWCEPCKRTLPAVQRLREKHADVRFIGVSEDEEEDTARAVASRYGLTFPIVHDVGQVLAGRYRVAELPVTFLIAPDGTVRWVGGPKQAEGDLALAMESLAR